MHMQKKKMSAHELGKTWQCVLNTANGNSQLTHKAMIYRHVTITYLENIQIIVV